MTREHKLALVVGFGLVLFVGILIADHLAAGRRGHDGPPPLTLVDSAFTLESGPREVILAPVGVRDAASGMRQTLPAENGVVEFAFEVAEAEQVPYLDRPSDSPQPGIGGHPTTDQGPRRHRVRSGERLADIADRYYGDRGQWKRIADANGITRPERLRSGVSITIPPRRETTDAPRRREPPQTRTYTVKSGDTLTIIAERQLGKQSRWREIQKFNGMPDALIVPGQELKLPTR
ncbi:MAG: LysM peptidoglycan-binding domain-containing protein [Planctomycetota bacterium]|nr:LysM peptidoglycan-binding domain-containing protein [Planctomycetota bacterium]